MSIEWLRYVESLRLPPGDGPLPLPDNLKPVAPQMEAFYRALPALLNEREQGRYAVMRGDRVESTWDTSRDAKQHAYATFDDDNFIVIQIDQRMLEPLKRYFGPAVSETA